MAAHDVLQEADTLEGEVHLEYQRQDAERAVRGLTGVKGADQLDHRKGPPDFPELKQKIEEALIRNAQTDAQRIDVEVQG